jgi:hypothetical protein
MALETLKGITKIDGFDVTGGASNFSKDRPVLVNHEANQIAFQIQNGPIKENGVNGCQVDTIVEAAIRIISGLNRTHPCTENGQTLKHLSIALWWLRERKSTREQKGIEGTNKQ